MFVLPKQNEVTSIYEYLRALHQRFFHEPKYTALHEEIQALRCGLNAALDESDQRLLLRLLDAQNELKNEVSLESFAAGFKLASGIAKELEADGVYSFDAEIEQQIENSYRWSK